MERELIRRQEDEESSIFNFRGTLTAHTAKHCVKSLHCVQHTGAVGEKQDSVFASSKTGSEVTAGSMAIYYKSESHGVQIGWCGLGRDSEVPEGFVYCKLLALQGGKKVN